MCFEMNCWRCKRSFRHVTARYPASVATRPKGAKMCVRFFLGHPNSYNYINCTIFKVVRHSPQEFDSHSESMSLSSRVHPTCNIPSPSSALSMATRTGGRYYR